MNFQTRISIAFFIICFIFLSAFYSSASLAQGDIATAQSALREGKVLLRRGKSDEAIGKLDSALRAFTANKSNRGQAAAHDALGELYERGGQYDTARTHYEQAHEAFTRAATDAKTSEAAAAEAIGLEDATGNEYNANLMLAKIGNMHVQAGKLSDARASFGRMKVVKPEEIKPEQSVQRVKQQEQKAKRGKGLFGRVASAASSAANAVRNDPLSAPDSARGVARSTTSEIKDAASTITGTIKLYRKLIVYATHEIGLGRVAYFDDDLTSAKTHFENALSATGGSALNIVGRLGQSSRFRTAARTALGDIAYRQNRFDDAVKIYREAAAGAQADNRLELMWSAQRGLGRSLRAQAATESNAQRAAKLRLDALASYRLSLATIERLRAGSLQADEARIVFLATTGDVFTEAASLLGEMAVLENKSRGGAATTEGQAREYAAEGLRIVEQGRARSLLDLLNEGGVEITAGVPAELVKARRANLERQQELAAEATSINLEASAQKTPRAPAEIETELVTLETEYVKLENAIRIASPRYAALTAPQPLALEAIQQSVLDGGTALVEYNLGEEKSYLWVVTREQLAVFELPSRAIIEAQVVELRNAIVPESLRREITQLTAKQSPSAQTATKNTSTVDAAAFARMSGALYKTILEPAASVIGNRRLLVVADGALNYIPFAALVTNSGAAAANANYSELAYLVKTNEVVVAPSASVIGLVNREKPTAARKMLIVADPVFAANDPRAAKAQTGNATPKGIAPALESAIEDVAAPSRSQGDASLVRLNGSRAEATQIAQLARTANLQADTLLDLEASEANVETRSAQDYRIIHVATHGLLNAERPQFTGLVLSLVGNQTTTNAPGVDGFLRTEEIFNLRTNAALVMLSACETGLGRERRGEGVIGLTRAFMYAGAPTVGVSLWSVSDRSTAILMTNFYGRMLSKEAAPPVAAMRAAQIEMIANPHQSAPFFWAPFVLVGNWR